MNSTIGSTPIPDAPARLRLVLDASYRIDALARHLRQCAGDESEGMPYVIEALTGQIEELACIIVSAADDESDPIEDIGKRFYHRRWSHEVAGDGTAQHVAP
jgi:hypothetical protein